MTENTETPQGESIPEAPRMSIPILPTEIDVVIVPVSETEDVLGALLSTSLTTTLVHLTRSQVIEFGAKLLKAGEKMKRQPQDARLSAVRKKLIVP